MSRDGAYALGSTALVVAALSARFVSLSSHESQRAKAADEQRVQALRNTAGAIQSNWIGLGAQAALPTSLASAGISGENPITHASFSTRAAIRLLSGNIRPVITASTWMRE